MENIRHQDVEKLDLACAPRWLLCFLLAILLVAGHVRCYELTQANREKQQQLAELTAEYTALQKETQRQNAAAYLQKEAHRLNMYRPSPEEYIILHLRSTADDE